MHRVLCFGGRGYSNAADVAQALTVLYDGLGKTPFAIIHGGARGADILAGNWGKSKGFPVIQVDANWDFYQKAAGGIRNQWMIDVCCPTYAVAFPGGVGTRDMTRRLRAADISVYVPYANLDKYGVIQP